MVKVVVTTYNRRTWTAEAIDSVLAQSHSQVHVVVVDDASTDGTAELAHAYAADQPRKITVIAKPENRGVADSVRIGLQASLDAPFVAFLNDDDQWYPSKLERQLELFARDPSLGLVFSEADVVDEQLRPTGESFSDLFGRFSSGSFEEALRANHAHASTLLLRQEIAALAARSMPRRSHVWDYYLVLVAAGYSAIGMVDEPLAIYRVGLAGLHAERARMSRDTTLARRELFARHPSLSRRLGGPKATRRELALRELDLAILHLRHREWVEYGWHSVALTRQRSLRPIFWLPIHTAKTLARKREGLGSRVHNECGGA